MRSFFVLCALCMLLGAFGQTAPAQTVTKIEGQIVCCEDCWVRADRKTVPYGTPADLVKSAECVGNGCRGDESVAQPIGGAV